MEIQKLKYLDLLFLLSFLDKDDERLEDVQLAILENKKVTTVELRYLSSKKVANSHVRNRAQIKLLSHEKVSRKDLLSLIDNSSDLKLVEEAQIRLILHPDVTAEDLRYLCTTPRNQEIYNAAEDALLIHKDADASDIATLINFGYSEEMKQAAFERFISFENISTVNIVDALKIDRISPRAQVLKKMLESDYHSSSLTHFMSCEKFRSRYCK